MNSETRMPAVFRSRDDTREVSLAPPATSRPPSVVRSSRRSGTRQHAWGKWRSAMASISSVAAISRLSGSVSSRLEPRDVLVGDVAAVLAQVRGDAVGAGFGGEVRGAQRDRDAAAARVADGGHVVDVHA